MSHPMVDLTEGWLNPNRMDTRVNEYYNRSLLLSYEVDWLDLWCDDYTCPSCQAYWADEVANPSPPMTLGLPSWG